jgi:hypothetical protein
MVYRGRLENSPQNSEGQVIVSGLDLVHKSQTPNYFSFEYSDFAAMRIGMSASASFHSVKKILIGCLGFGGVAMDEDT